jgi:transposase-like protein
MNEKTANQVKEKKGIEIVKTKKLKKIDNATYRVPSQSNPKAWYTVNWQKDHWACDCMDYQKSTHHCKHVYAVRYYQTLEKIRLDAEFLGEESGCPVCKQTDQVIKRGIRFNRNGQTQRYFCKVCKRRFTGRTTGFEGMKNRADIIAASLDLYYRGLSLRQIVQHLETSHKIKISHGTIYYWIKKYVELIGKYTQGLNAKFSERWHADETVLKVNGRHLLLWSLLDSETRFLIATHISQKRGEEDASALLKKALKTSKEQPMEIVTDGLESYSNAIKKELGTDPEKPVIHLQGSLTKALNNKMERMNGTIKSRTKSMAGMYDEGTTMRFADGFSIYYNYMRPHIALHHMTPAMMLGITNEQLTWLDMIVKSKKSLENPKEQ